MFIILATQEAEIEEITVHDQPGQKYHETPISTNKSWVWWLAPVTPARQEAKIGR
jgi:hypothetical protein